jgi:hypothetical protein
MRFLGWFRGDKPELVPLNANQFLEMMSVTCVAWLLLEQAIIAESRLVEMSEDDPDRPFYLGKRYAARYYANLELGQVISAAKHIGEEHMNPLLIPDEAFSTLA